jgi:hypothetical protein
VYAFTLSAAAGHSAPCGPGTVLMVAKARANNEQRFRQWQYDGTGDPSTLAGSLLVHRILWPWLGISRIDETTVGEWMLTSIDRVHFFIPAGHPHVFIPAGYPHVRDALAAYVRGTAGSVFHRSFASGGIRNHLRATYHQAMPGALGLRQVEAA